MYLDDYGVEILNSTMHALLSIYGARQLIEICRVVCSTSYCVEMTSTSNLQTSKYAYRHYSGLSPTSLSECRWLNVLSSGPIRYDYSPETDFGIIAWRKSIG